MFSIDTQRCLSGVTRARTVLLWRILTVLQWCSLACCLSTGKLVVSLHKDGETRTVQLDQATQNPGDLKASWETLIEHTLSRINELPKPDPQYFAICVAIKDQHRDVREWIEHHKALGCGKIYMFDNNSTVPVSLVVQDYIDTGLIDYFQVSSSDYSTFGKQAQRYIYNRCLQDFGQYHNWIGFIDVDEFLFLRDDTPNMPALLKDYEDYPALAVNWVLFGSSGHKARPKGGVLKNYLQCLPPEHGDNSHIKTIVNTKKLVTPCCTIPIGDKESWNVWHGPHHLRSPVGPDLQIVDELYRPVEGPKTSTVTHSRIALHHYVLKSLEEYQEKMTRGSAMGNHKSIVFFERMDDLATANCTDALLPKNAASRVAVLQ